MVDLATRTHRRLLAVVGVILVATLVGMIILWPRAAQLPEVDAPPEDLVDATVLSVDTFETESDPMIGFSGEMANIVVEVTSGPDEGQTLELEISLDGYPEFTPGDRIHLSAVPGPEGDLQYFITDFQRLPALSWLFGLFVGAVLLIGRWQGLRSLIGLGLSLLIVVRFIVPGILAGQSPPLIALVGAMAVMIVTLYFAHGVNEMTTSAVIGTSAALLLTIAIGMLFVDQGKLTGFASEEASLARFAVEGLDLRGLVLAGLIIAALGVLDDVTISQASTVFALHDTDRQLSWAALFGRAMKVGRDHIASVVNTLFLAYTGASLALLVLFSTGGLPVSEIVNSEILAEEIIKTVVGSLGLIAAVPFTTALAASVAVRRPVGAPPLGGHLHHHGGHSAEAAPGPAPASDRPSPRVHTGDPDEDAAYESWIGYLREGPRGHDVESDHDDTGDGGAGDSR